MTLLITIFLVLVNIFNTITTNIPKAEGLTAIEAWVIGCVLFVFGALIGKEAQSWFDKVQCPSSQYQPWLLSLNVNRCILRCDCISCNV